MLNEYEHAQYRPAMESAASINIVLTNNPIGKYYLQNKIISINPWEVNVLARVFLPIYLHIDGYLRS